MTRKSACELTDEQAARLEALPAKGTAAHGWNDRRGTGARVAVPRKKAGGYA
ncbi:hypothetical protein FHS43_005806 [Streptosporangium becharense]|uniref:Transposase n=1 Tax=Streptosporangium becharense TaxID=1816182 RepID=A0A7W9IM91_9ACTN|nr:hypothetical protein [Streptosporangium becharense]MBB2914494.1 hypothetical protein [Streptosporangium becharense]MBB5823339.1 hypothetical protein [Streptosporangium becharense]